MDHGGTKTGWEENRVINTGDRRQWEGHQWEGHLQPDRSRLWKENEAKDEACGYGFGVEFKEDHDNRTRMATSIVVMHEPFRGEGVGHGGQHYESGICFSSAVIVVAHEFGGWQEGVDYNHEPGGFAVGYTRADRRLGIRYPTMEEAFERACSRLVRQQRRIIEHPWTQNAHRQRAIIEWARGKARENLAPVSEKNPELRWRVEQNAFRSRGGEANSQGEGSGGTSSGEQADLFV